MGLIRARVGSVKDDIGETRAGVVGRRNKVRFWLHRPCHSGSAGTNDNYSLSSRTKFSCGIASPVMCLRFEHTVQAPCTSLSHLCFCLAEGTPPATLQTQDGLAVSPARLSPHPALYMAKYAVECCLWVPCGPDF